MVKSAFLRLAGNCREISKIILLCYEGKKNCFYLGEMVHNYSCLEAADRTPIHLKFHIQRLLVFCMWFSLGVLVCPLTRVFPGGRKQMTHVQINIAYCASHH